MVMVTISDAIFDYLMQYFNLILEQKELSYKQTLNR